MKIQVTHDEDTSRWGLVLWPERSKLKLEDGEWFDTDCNDRGEAIPNIMREMIGRDMNPGERVVLEVTECAQAPSSLSEYLPLSTEQKQALLAGG